MIAITPGYPPFSYSERIPGSPVYSFVQGMSRVERTFKTAWANRWPLVLALLGYPKYVSAGSDSYVSRQIPDKIRDISDPTKPNKPWLFASQVVRMVGKGETGLYDPLGVPIYQEVELTVAYEPRTYNILSDAEMIVKGNSTPNEFSLARYVTRFQKPGAEFIQLPRGVMRWVDGVLTTDSKGVSNHTPVDYASARLIPSCEISLTWHEVPFIPDAATDFVGCLNYTPFDDGVRKLNGKPNPYPAGTVLLLASEIKPYRTAAGVFVSDIVYRLKYQEPQDGRGFNFFLRYDKFAGQAGGGLVYEKLTTDGENDLIAIQPDGIPGSPYNLNAIAANQRKVLANLTAGSGATGVYGYANFYYLFQPSYPDSNALFKP